MCRFICFVFVVSSMLVDGANRWLNNGDFCETPFGAFGTCELVRNCSYVKKIFSKPDFSPYDEEYLNSLKCGEMNNRGKKPFPLVSIISVVITIMLGQGMGKPCFETVCCPSFENVHCKDEFSNRIYDGITTQRGEFPWAALLFYDVGINRPVPKCGGSLISELYVITAAHCTAGKPQWQLLFARFNEFNTSSKENCTFIDEEEICRYDYAIESIIPHPDYGRNQNSQPNDICILRLATAVTFNFFVKPICLPLETDVQGLPVVKHNFTVTGWGETENAMRSELQLHVVIPGLDNTVCNSVYKVANVTLSDKQLCVGGLNGTDSCRGDSGGPLMRNVSNIWYLAGVVSFGARLCGTEGLPGVYTNVEKYLSWIEDITFVEQYW